MMAWYRPSLEKLSHIAFILMCLAVTAVGVQRLTAARAVPAAGAPPFPAGTKLTLHPDLAPGASRASLVVALSTTCQFCTASMPFYRRLAELDAVRDGRLRFSVLTLQADEAMREYMGTHGLSVKTLVQARDGGIPIQGTPTLVIFDRNGAVAHSWAGRLRPDEEDAVIKEITRLTSS